MLQRTIRERQWRAQAMQEADQALKKSNDFARAEQLSMSAMRFTAQRTRLLERERAFQAQNAAGAMRRRPIKSAMARGVVGSPRSKLRTVRETDEEVQARIALVEAHAHRATAAAQQRLKGAPGFRPAPPSVEATRSRTQPVSPRRKDDASGESNAARPASTMSARGRSGHYTSDGRRPGTAPALRAGVHPTPPSYRPMGTISPRMPPAPKYASDVEAVTAIALNRHAWIQTPMAREVVEMAAARALKPAVERMSEQAVGSGAKAAALLARRACEGPPSRVPQAELLNRKQIFVSPRLVEPRSATAKIAAMWDDSTLKSANVKEQRAIYGKWRAQRRAFLRSNGLRHTVLIEEEQRTGTVHRMQTQELLALDERMRIWQMEDDAAIRIQQSWQSLRMRRKRATMMKISLSMRAFQMALIPPANLQTNLRIESASSLVELARRFTIKSKLPYQQACLMWCTTRHLPRQRTKPARQL